MKTANSTPSGLPSLRATIDLRYRGVRRFIAMALMATAVACDASKSTDSVPAVQNVRLDQTQLTLDEGATARLKVLSTEGGSTREINAADATWSTSDPTVLSVNAGLISALRPGSARVTALVNGKHSAAANVQVVSIPGSIEIMMGNQQAGVVDAALLSPVRVRVLSRQGLAMANTPVEFVLADGADGAVTQASPSTDENGILEMQWKLGTKAGPQTLEARIVGRPNPTATIQAEAAPGPLTFVEVSPSDVLTNPGRETAFQAFARDQFGNEVPGATITWSTTDSEVAVVTSDGRAMAVADGEAEIEATAAQLGQAVGAMGSGGQATRRTSSWTRFRVSGYLGTPGWINDLSASKATSTGATLSFTEVGDGTGRVASYAIGFKETPMGDGRGATPVTTGTCASPIKGTKVGAKRSCTVTGLKPGVSYDFQMVAVSSALSKYGLPSNIVTIRTNAPTPSSISISPATYTLNAIGATVQLSAAAKSNTGGTVSNAAITWASSNNQVATVDGSGRVTARAAGSAVISASSSCCDAGLATVEVTPAVSSLALSPASSTVSVGGSQQLVATAKDSNGNVLTGVSLNWSSTNAAVASVSSSGVVTAKSAGSANITASTSGKSATANVSVSQQAPSTPSALQAVSGDGQSGAVGSTLGSPLTVVVKDGSGKALPGVAVKWSVTSGGGSLSDASTVTDGQGQARVNWTLGTAPVASSAKATVSGAAAVTFSASATPGPVATISVSPGSTSVTAGGTEQFAAEAVDQYGNVLSGASFAWSSTNTGAATVSSSGLAKGVKAGSAEIRASTGGKTGSGALAVGAGAVTGNPAKITNLTVVSTDANSATLRFTEVNDGTGKSAQYYIGYYPGPMAWNWGSATPASKGTCGGPIAGTTIGAVRTCTLEGLDPSQRYDFQMVAFRGTLNNNAVFGPLSNVATGTTTAGSGGDKSNNGTISITPNGGTLNAIGATLQLKATAKDGSGAAVTNPGITWSSANPAVATVDANGRVTAKSVGTAVIAAMAACCTAEQVTVTVQPTVSSVSVSPSTATVEVGASTQLSALVKDLLGNLIPGVLVQWSSSNTSIATVNSAGVVTGKAAGEVAIAATILGKSAVSTVSVTGSSGGGGGSGGSKTFANEPTSWTLVSDRPMATTGNNGGSDETAGSGPRLNWYHSINSYMSALSDQSPEPISPSSAYRFRFNSGRAEGGVGQQTGTISQSNIRKVYLGFTLKTSNWIGHASSITKLFWIDAHPSMTIVKMDGAYQKGPFRVRITNEHVGANIPSLNIESGDGGSAVNVSNNNWYTVEVIEERPTSAGQKGRVRVWVNGVLTINAQRAWASDPITQVTIMPYLGGVGGATSSMQDIFIGHFKMRVSQ